MHRLADQFEEWLATRNAALESAVAELGMLPADQWQEVASAFPSMFRCEAVHALSERAHELLGANPATSVAFTRLATRIVDSMRTNAFDLRFAEIAGEAYRAYAAALFEVAQYADAEDACDVAEVFYDIGGMELVRQSALLGFVKGKVFFFLRRRAEGLQLIESSANLLLSLCDDRKKYVEGRTLYAGLLVHDQRYQEAADILEDSIAYAESESDTLLMAHIVDLAGACHYGLGEYGRAKECLETARQIFQELGLETEAFRVREGLVHVLVAQGRYNEAISEQFAVRSEYLRLSLPILAALAAVDIVDYLFLANRLDDIAPLCLEMIDTFTKARLSDRAMRALAYLNELAQQRKAGPEHVDEVRSVLRSLGENAEPSRDERGTGTSSEPPRP